MTKIQLINDVKTAPAAVGPYSQGVNFGDFYFFSGQIALDPETAQITGDTKEQTLQVFKNIKALLTSQGLTLNNVIKATVFIIDMNEFTIVNEIYGNEFNGHKPARSTVEVSALPKGGRVEIEVIAVRNS